MFVLTELQDTLQLPHQSLSIPLQDAITQELANLYFDKVLKGLGLSVTLYDISNVEGGSVFPGAGAPHFTDCAASLGDFFLRTYTFRSISCSNLPYYEEEKLWAWNYKGTAMWVMDLEEDIRFQVVEVKYPPIPVEQEKDARPFAPMTIKGDINADGLRLISWDWS